MIVGVGIDLVDIPRVRRLLAGKVDRVLARLCTPAETEYIRSRPDPAVHLAARIAAKEAAFKALSGSPEAREIGWREMEVVSGFHGEPMLRLTGRAAERAGVLGVDSSWLTLSHTDATAGAVVILERGAPGNR